MLLSTYIIIPLQVFPFPVNPGLHKQRKEPSVFLQLAFTSQKDSDKLHSSASKTQQQQQKVIIVYYKKDVFFCLVCLFRSVLLCLVVVVVIWSKFDCLDLVWFVSCPPLTCSLQTCSVLFCPFFSCPKSYALPLLSCPECPMLSCIVRSLPCPM